MKGCSKSCGNFSKMATRISSMPCFSLALIAIGFCWSSLSICATMLEVFSRISALFKIRITGMFLLFNCCIHSFSTCKSFSSQRSRAMSVRSIAFKVRSMRISPSVPSSSNPGVSIRTQGPMPCNSMALLTGSVVVPGISDTKAVSCPVKALISDDFPLLRRPKRAMCRRLAEGVLLRLMVYVFKTHHRLHG